MPESPVAAFAVAAPWPVMLTDRALPVAPDVSAAGTSCPALPVLAARVIDVLPAPVAAAGPAPGIAVAVAGPPTDTATATLQRHLLAELALETSMSADWPIIDRTDAGAAPMIAERNAEAACRNRVALGSGALVTVGMVGWPPVTTETPVELALGSGTVPVDPVPVLVPVTAPVTAGCTCTTLDPAGLELVGVVSVGTPGAVAVLDAGTDVVPAPALDEVA
jgi:hypothetical protein